MALISRLVSSFPVHCSMSWTRKFNSSPSDLVEIPYNVHSLFNVILEFYIHRQPDLCSFAWVRLFFFFCAKKASVNHISVKDRGLLQLGFNWVWGDGITHSFSFYRVSVPFQIFNYESTLLPSVCTQNQTKIHLLLLSTT